MISCMVIDTVHCELLFLILGVGSLLRKNQRDWFKSFLKNIVELDFISGTFRLRLNRSKMRE